MVPKGHPLRRVKELADQTLTAMSADFDPMYSQVGRPSIPPERLLKSLLLIAFHSVRSERLFCEQLHYNMLFRWFLDMGLDEDAFDASTFSQNRERLLQHDVGALFLMQVVERAKTMGLMSDDHFSVDGSLIEAWASMKTFQKKDAPQKPPDDPGNPTIDFHGEQRSNETHESKTDPDARLARKGNGKESKLAHHAHALVENRNGLVVGIMVTAATGRAEREAALQMLEENHPRGRGSSVGGDKGYDSKDFVRECREMSVTPHVAQKKHSAIDGRTTRHAGYTVSQRFRKRIEEVWGWMKTVAGFRKTRYRGQPRVNLSAQLFAAAYDLLRIAKLSPT
jgi:transposase